MKWRAFVVGWHGEAMIMTFRVFSWVGYRWMPRVRNGINFENRPWNIRVIMWCLKCDFLVQLWRNISQPYEAILKSFWVRWIVLNKAFQTRYEFSSCDMSLTTYARAKTLRARAFSHFWLSLVSSCVGRSVACQHNFWCSIDWRCCFTYFSSR